MKEEETKKRVKKEKEKGEKGDKFTDPENGGRRRQVVTRWVLKIVKESKPVVCGQGNPNTNKKNPS